MSATARAFTGPTGTLMPIDQACTGATPVVVEVSTRLDDGQFHWLMSAAAGTPPRIVVSPIGDLDFSRQRGPILVTLRLLTSGWVWRAQNTMEFNVEPVRIVRNFVQPDNEQVRLRPLAGQELTFCYANSRASSADRADHPRSYYGLWVQNGGQNFYIDPIISNGGNAVRRR